MMTIHTPTLPLLPSRGVQCTHRGAPSASVARPGTQRTLAVTPLPDASAAVNSSRTRVEPPMRLRKGDCSIPGVRKAGEAKIMRNEGYGRTRRYCRFVYINLRGI